MIPSWHMQNKIYQSLASSLNSAGKMLQFDIPLSGSCYGSDLYGVYSPPNFGLGVVGGVFVLLTVKVMCSQCIVEDFSASVYCTGIYSGATERGRERERGERERGRRRERERERERWEEWKVPCPYLTFPAWLGGGW